MLLRNSISNTKKFFQKTIENVKSFLSKGTTYQRLPKTPPCHPFSCGRDSNETDPDSRSNNPELDAFYTEFTNQWDSRKSKTKNKSRNNPIHSSTINSHQFFLPDSCQTVNCTDFPAGNSENRKTPDRNGDFDRLKSKRFYLSPGNVLQKTDLCSRSVREKRLSFVAEKLKDIEVIDKGNFDHKLDFDEFLHCYSRLTCPAYLDIVDKFLTEMCREFLDPQKGCSMGRKPAKSS